MLAVVLATGPTAASGATPSLPRQLAVKPSILKRLDALEQAID